ncbi:hypothetical protein SteCoe_21513 [Stentor coeruleus]|uniref:RING-type E3 ubiquitin transferase n=1 Tax=Stentor coeruleus TaxID=5963 RepID=A0A1R2BPJ0_9CILI|nr:hypothetical protein SteCoe_21513 [Stentor coeruleus]
MDRRRMRVTLVVVCALSIFMISKQSPKINKNNIVDVKPNLEDQFEKEKEFFDGIWKLNNSNTEYYLSLGWFYYDNSSNFLSLTMFQGNWKSDPYWYISAGNLDYNSTEHILTAKIVYKLENGSGKNFNGTLYAKVLNNDSTELEGIVICDGKSVIFKAHAKNKQKEMFTRLYYAFMISVGYLIIIAALAKHFQVIYENSAQAEKTSLFSLGLMEVCELGFALWQLEKSFEGHLDSGIDYILISSFWSFSAFMLIHSKLLPIVFRAQNSNISSFGFYVSSRMTANYQSRFFLLCIIYIIILKLLKNFYYLTMPIVHMIFIPQIITNSLYGYKDSISFRNAGSILLCKLIIALYLFGCPSNFMRYEPNYLLCTNLIIICLGQILVLKYQQFKPRFLVPRKYRPMSYDYFRDESEESNLSRDNDNTCIICMTPLNIPIVHNEPIVNRSKTMHTPCSHRFHQDCLVQWIEIKLECPTCRSRLPVFEG